MGDKRYKITIRNWDKYQREMQGGEKRKRRREWVAVSTGLLHDPDFFRLTIEQRYLWLMLLCYAGAVGPVFELSASDARVLFKLRRSAVFQPLADQGLIDLQAATRQDKQDKTDIPPTEGVNAPSVRDQVWNIGPKIIGSSQTDRAYLGKLIRDHGEGSVLHALTETKKHGTGDPKSYIRGILRESKPTVADGFGAFDD